ncbi:hypothetical protein C9J45_05940 [Photobacterium sp. GB-1]|nr:hypothetical protein C9J45_05940 [Photobacterium sp. GB-1]
MTMKLSRSILRKLKPSLLVTLSFVIFVVFIATYLIIINLPVFGLNLESFNALTQNFTNMAMPVVTLISVSLLFISINESTKQHKITRIDHLIDCHIKHLDELMAEKVTVPYAISIILSDDGKEKVDWTVRTLLIQLNAFLNHESKLDSNIKAAIFDWTRICDLKDLKFYDLLNRELDDVTRLMTIRQNVELDRNRNSYIWSKLELIPPVLVYIQVIDEDTCYTITEELKLNELLDQFDEPCNNHAQSLIEFSDRLSIFKGVSAADLCKKNKDEIKDLIKAA